MMLSNVLAPAPCFSIMKFSQSGSSIALSELGPILPVIPEHQEHVFILLKV